MTAKSFVMMVMGMVVVMMVMIVFIISPVHYIPEVLESIFPK
ncbi:MAG TPA: hypothetical protein VLG45_02095 [Thermodesulfobacteriota bacterium]|nr:hypothetical protein [Thermodesulfobacteriota bacterium]